MEDRTGADPELELQPTEQSLWFSRDLGELLPTVELCQSSPPLRDGAMASTCTGAAVAPGKPLQDRFGKDSKGPEAE